MTFQRQLAVIAIGLACHVHAGHVANHRGGGGSTVDYTQPGLKVVPRRGTSGNSNDGNIVYGPMENGFLADQTSQQFGCTNGLVLAGGIDTREAERMVHAQAALGNCREGVSILNDCGGHAVPFHYHERMTCLHTNDAGTGHSTSVATMLDGKMLYGKWEDANAVPPVAAYDLVDACNGHFGTTPDSPTTEVYHYHVTDLAPLTTGCFGPAVVNGAEAMVTVAMCRSHHASVCGDGDEVDLTTVNDAGGVITKRYDLECPCYDGNNSNAGMVPLPFESSSVPSVAPTAAPSTAPTTTTPTAIGETFSPTPEPTGTPTASPATPVGSGIGGSPTPPPTADNAATSTRTPSVLVLLISVSVLVLAL